MSLYELESMMRSFSKLEAEAEKNKPMTPERLAAMKEKWAAMNLPDVKVH